VAKIGVFKVGEAAADAPEGARLFRAEAPLSPMPQPKVTQGAVEESNVQPIIEITRMMGDLRNYQFLGQFVQTEANRQMTAVQKIIQKYRVRNR
jgi:flagellar basal-body rod protein FlgF